FRLAHLRDERLGVLLADAVRDDRPVGRLLFPEHGHSSLTLAPRAHDRHGSLLSCLPVWGLPSRRNRAGSIGPFPQPAGGRSCPVARANGPCAGPCEALFMSGRSPKNTWGDSTARSWW